MYRAISLATALIASVRAQQACTSTQETHPALTWSKCTTSGCTEVSGSVVVDANWRWTHTVEGSTNCYTGNEWDTSICPDGKTCAEKCCVDGADYAATYGVTTSGNQLSLSFVTKGAYATNVGSRLYLMEDDETYQMFDLLGNEFTFDVDVSQISCGVNGALYFVSMDEDGGMAKSDGNKAGAKYGTGYCDAQCARDVKFINGEANVENWTPSESDPNSGTGNLGACCPEMDIWEANDISTAYTPHPCKTLTYHTCEGDDCGGTYSTTRYAGTCDPDGCDFNPYRQGNETFYGPGSEFTVDTTKKVTVVTQFIKGSSGGLSEIKRFYVQNGKVISNAESKVTNNPGNSVTEDFCTAQKKAFGDDDDFTAKGGFSQMSDALAAPMVLTMSLWDDHKANLLWLDSTYPVDATGAGAKRGTCSTDSGVPSEVEAEAPDSKVSFSNIKFGPIGTTFEGGDSASSDSGSSASPSKAASSAAPVASKSASAGAQTSVAASKPQTTVVQSIKPSSVAVQSPSSAAAEVPKASSSQAAAVPSNKPATTEVNTPVATEDEEEEECEADPEDAQATSAKPAATTTAGSGSQASAQPSSAQASAQPSSDSGSSSAAGAYQRCGGQGWTGATTCVSGYTCKEQNTWYSQCVASA
ncbi:putative exoglucanase type C [Fusarium kuroshium]|uniref:Glucanase n=2 Tax=Fusarium solani species complex TaxID=232080 RepID=A0A3M2S3B8_9HYPO|nr:putative exoglucanase type C [Fusarium kuroshium]RSL77813.1 putative exoglucanase type C [Fusarium floridanum]